MQYAINQAPFELGETRTSIPHNQLGMTFTFTDRTAADPELLESASPVVAQLVQNTSGGDLVRGTRVRFEAGEVSKKVDTTAGDEETCHGLVDPYVGSANVKNNEFFYIILQGMCTALSDGSAVAGSDITGGASGKVKLMPGTPTAATNVARCGISNAAGGNDGDYIRVFFKASSQYG